MKEFNTTATCIPRMHYMVDISEKLDLIEKMIIGGKYFTINRSRQYGKTTTFAALYRKLKNEYEIIRLSFEGAGSGAFQSDMDFVTYFIRNVYMSNRRLSKVVSAHYFGWNHLPQSAVHEARSHYFGCCRRLSRVYFSSVWAGLK